MMYGFIVEWRQNASMKNSTIREKVLNEIDKIPEDKLTNILDLIHHFRIGLQHSREGDIKVEDFSGCWEDMPDSVYENFLTQLKERRGTAFSRRRNRETNLG